MVCKTDQPCLHPSCSLKGEQLAPLGSQEKGRLASRGLTRPFHVP